MNFDENLAHFGCGLDEECSMSTNAAAFLKSYARTTTVFNAVNAAENNDKKLGILRDYLDFCYECQNGNGVNAKNVVNISVKGAGFESITSSALPDLLRDSVSTLYLVEFFTHCCINCIHSIEDVRQVHEEIEKQYGATLKESKSGFRGLKVLSVHSPKFPREKDFASIKAFCKRNRMDHSIVINDPDCLLWNELGVTCWPTLLVLGPNLDGKGFNLLFNFMGEGHKNDLHLTLQSCLEYFQKNLIFTDAIKNGDVVDAPKAEVLNSSNSDLKFLQFPGKVAVNGDQIIISDSGNNRLVRAQLTGEVIDIIGGSGKGFRDGGFTEAKFYNPQGIAFENESIFYVADTGNHAIRKVDILSKQVSTIISPGHVVQVDGQSETLKSPWDLAFYDSSTLVVAAAGNHRLFGYFFNDTTLFGVEHKRDTFAIIAGSGREENRNNSYIMKASFAQPSGISVLSGSNDEKCIYIADSESSSIRTITSKGQVVGVVGGSRDPTDLFAFGDVDGKGINVKLQHPMGVCAGATPSNIFVADTYNHKIKDVNIVTKECLTVVSNGLNEPSGICRDAKRGIIYVADTNNHSIKIFDPQLGTLSEMELAIRENLTKPIIEKFDKHFSLSVEESLASLKLHFLISPLPSSFEGGQWKIQSSSLKFEASRGNIIKNEDLNEGQFTVNMTNFGGTVVEFYIFVDIFFCGSNSCMKQSRKIKVTCAKDNGASDEPERTLVWNDVTWDF